MLHDATLRSRDPLQARIPPETKALTVVHQERDLLRLERDLLRRELETAQVREQAALEREQAVRVSGRAGVLSAVRPTVAVHFPPGRFERN